MRALHEDADAALNRIVLAVVKRTPRFEPLQRLGVVLHTRQLRARARPELSTSPLPLMILRIDRVSVVAPVSVWARRWRRR